MLANTFVPRCVKSNHSSEPANLLECRLDRRKDDDTRPLFCEIGVVADASGSAYIEIGKTKVMCSVQGPAAPQRGVFSDTGSLECDVRYAPFACSDIRSMQAEERYMSSMLEDCLKSIIHLECYPKTVISLNAVILQVQMLDILFQFDK